MTSVARTNAASASRLLVLACSARKRGWVPPLSVGAAALQLPLALIQSVPRIQDDPQTPAAAPPLPRPAYDVYDGPAYRVLRAAGYPAREPDSGLELVILSAEHGLLSPFEPIIPYDRRMDPVRARDLAGTPPRQLRSLLRHAGIDDDQAINQVLVAGGALYRSVFARWAAAGLFAQAEILYTRGPIGTQLSQLRRWLTAATPSAPSLSTLRSAIRASPPP